MAAVQAEVEPAPARAPGLPPGLDPDLYAACLPASGRLGGPWLRSLGVTSSVRGEGRTSIALALAAIHAVEYRRQVVLVDMDVAKPALGSYLDLGGAPGLAEVLRFGTNPNKALHRIDSNLSVMTAGTVHGDHARLLAEATRQNILETLHSNCDIVIADLPPLTEAVAGPLPERQFERMLFVVRSRWTPESRMHEALAQLSGPPAVLLNDASSALPRWLRSLTGF